MITRSALETEKLGKQLAEKAKNGVVIALYGELGSGKTTFVKGLARGLGIKNRIISPTFIFIREYEIMTKEGAKEICPELCSKRSLSSDGRTKRGDLESEMKTMPAGRQELASAKYLYHIDLYRINRPEDSRGLGLEEILSNPQNIVVIEWAEKIKKILPKKRIDIFFKYLDEDKREILIIN